MKVAVVFTENPIEDGPNHLFMEAEGDHDIEQLQILLERVDVLGSYFEGGFPKWIQIELWGE
jgi:hypothetical protein